jgi:hypothetical protein
VQHGDLRQPRRPQPQVVGRDLDDVADQLIRRYGAKA